MRCENCTLVVVIATLYQQWDTQNGYGDTPGKIIQIRNNNPQQINQFEQQFGNNQELDIFVNPKKEDD